MYQPSDDLLKKYAHIFINFALGQEKGIRPEETVFIAVPECARPMLTHLHNAVLEAGGHPVVEIIPDDLRKEFFARANDEQIAYQPMNRLMGQIKDMDHRMYIIAEADKYELAGVDPKKILARAKSVEEYRKALFKKDDDGELTWTLGMYGTQAMADDVGLSLEEYWQQIIDACFLEEDDPIAKWKEVYAEMYDFRDKLNALRIESVHVQGEDADLHVQIGNKRLWKTGSGCNIPSFEIFTSPDWRGTNGWIRFNQPLYYNSNIIEGIQLWFEDGIVVKSSATKNEALLKEMLAQENANKAGEYSLTDRRHSRITKFMGETLYDENVGGEFGNTHLAVGMSYKDCYDGETKSCPEELWEELGYNDSIVHTDIMSTTDRTVTATLPDGSQKVIYEKGQFTL